MHAEAGKRQRWLIPVALGIIYIIWGSTYLAIRFAIETMPPFLMAGLRFTFAGALLYGVMRLRVPERPTLRQWLHSAVIGGLLFVGGNGLVVWAELTVASGMAALLIATVPLWMVMLEWLVFRGNPPRLLVVIGLVVGTAGVALLIGPGDLKTGNVNPWGGGALLLACAFWSLGSLISRRADQPRNVFVAVALQMFTSGLMLLVIATVLGEWGQARPERISAKSILSFVYLFIFGSMIALSAYIWLLRVCSPATVATYAYVNPIVAVLLGYLFADEPLTMRTFYSSALIVAAVVLVTVSRGRPAASFAKPAATETPGRRAQRSSDPNKRVANDSQPAAVR